ncbi:MAG: VanZ family protein [Eubacterium sp.]|nr:VanZ family protein [Eubacterium sp.]
MEDLILTGYEFLTVMLPALLLAGMFYLSKKKLHPKAAIWHSLFLLVFAYYLYGVFHFTGTGTIFHVKQYGIALSTASINLIPFSSEAIDLTGYGLNVVLFMPLGFFLPFLWEKYDRLPRACVFGFLLSLLVEISQLLNIRATDVDDLILNTLGTVLGFVLFRLYVRLIKRTARAFEDDTASHRPEAFFFVALLFLCRFFTYYEFGMAKMLYHF